MTSVTSFLRGAYPPEKNHGSASELDKLLDLFSEIAALSDRLKTIQDENKEFKKAAENAKEDYKN